MQTVTQIPRDILYQDCTANNQNASILLEKPSHPEFQNISVQVPFPGISDVQCQSLTTLHSCFTQTTPPGKRKNDTKQSVQSCSNSQNQIEPMQSPQMLFNNYSDPRGKFVQPYDSYVQPTQPHQYFVGNVPPNGYQQQVQRPYLTITQFNYQPAGFQQFPNSQPSMSTTNIKRGTPSREIRFENSEPLCRYISSNVTSQYKIDTNPACNNDKVEKVSVKKSEADSEAAGSFEYTIQPEQLVKSLCDEREYDFVCSKVNKTHVRSLSCGSPGIWNAGPVIQQQTRTEDDQFTKCLAQGCLQAEAIAVRNQNRPCFKNIKHLCTRTRTDILKPKTTVANIHSQGIPWATKDFIFAFIRLINCWHILSGYLENDEGSLGKIDTALTPEIREKYYRWKNESKDLLILLNNLFLNLDKGVTIQNAEIFSKFNNLVMNHSSTVYNSPPLNDPNNSNSPVFTFCQKDTSSEPSDCHDNKSPVNFMTKTSSEQIKQDESFNKEENFAPLNVPGILIVKKIFNDSNPVTKTEEVDVHRAYIKPGTYVPLESAADKETSTHTDQSDTTNVIPDSWESLVYSPVVSADLQLNNNKTSESQMSSDCVWKNAIQTTGSFIKRMMNNVSDIQTTEKMSKTCQTNEEMKPKNTKDVESWVTEHCFESTVEDNTEEEGVANAKQAIKFKKHILSSKSSNKKNMIGTRIYKKKSEDRDTNNNNNKVFRYKNGNKSQNKYLSKKTEVNKTENDIIPKRILGLSPVVVSKFEKIIHKLWLLPFSKFVTFEVNAEYVPDYYKHVCKPMFLCNVMNSLKQNKYNHVNEVIHDLRTIVWNSELYIQKRPDWWFEKCLHEFSNELESQIANKFANVNFSSVSGDPSQVPALETDTKQK